METSIEKKEEVECEHTDLVEGVCVDCGLEQAQFTGCTTSKKQIKLGKAQHKSIFNDLEKLGFAENIASRADQIYMGIEKKGSRKKLIMFYCVFHACNDLQIIEDPTHLAEKIGIAKDDIGTALNNFTNAKNKYQPQRVQHTPLDMIHLYYQHFSDILTEQDKEEIMKVATRVLQKDDSLMEENPKKIAGGILQYYMSSHNIPFDKKRLASTIKLSDVTINNTYRMIMDLENS